VSQDRPAFLATALGNSPRIHAQPTWHRGRPTQPRPGTREGTGRATKHNTVKGSLGGELIPALLVLEDGSVFHGQSFGAQGTSVGEVVFNTAMTGYQEILTDPSYTRQIVTLTYPQIGNTGVNLEDVESDGIHAAGLVIRQLPRRASNWRMTRTLPDYLQDQGIVGHLPTWTPGG
jgi:hypothetical protein